MRALLITLLALNTSICSAQIYLNGRIEAKDSCYFQSICSIIQLDSSEDNIWTIGKPSKLIFTEGLNDSFALFTDTSMYYKENVSSSFEIFAPNYPGSNYSYLDGNALLSFYHKLNSDTLKDGGFIEISYDEGVTWVNVLKDSFNIENQWGSPQNMFGLNMYTGQQTLVNNQPGFSGNIPDWTLCEVPLIRFIPVFAKSSTRIRFTFISDSIPSEKEGWMIDNIKLSSVWLPGGLTQVNSSTNILSVYPNPCSDHLTVTSLQDNFNGTLSILDIEGRTIFSMVLTKTNTATIDVGDFAKGFYTLLYHDNIKGDYYSKLAK